ncbi:MAG: arginine--tRNA ligase [Candidatus Pacebacteria bacterium]|nr:arginine--tRNA ligase [Candidatus Paceibacterota bacterium]MDD5621118.1 arginine--tRNA ligase [Candidatus Paceibacterota bacterium]
MIKEKVRQFVIVALQKGQKDGIFPEFDYSKILITRPETKEHGDFSTNLSFLLSAQFKINPVALANNLVEVFLETDKEYQMFEKIESINGFINFRLCKDIYFKELKEILRKKNRYGDSLFGKRKKVQVEFISANPTGPLTVGNARGGPFGDCLANILQKSGFISQKEYYVNNSGNQIAILGHSVLKDELSEYKGEYIEELHKENEEKDPDKAGKLAAKMIIDRYIRKTTDRMNIKYDKWFFEEELHRSGKIKQIINILTDKGYTYLKDKAFWFRSTDFGDERDRVLIKKDGQPTYLAADIAYHLNKFQERGFDKVINIWGADHYGDVAGLKAGVSAIGFPDQLEIILLQFVTVIKDKEVIKMSKRTGTYITMDELLDMVGSDAAKYFFLSRGADTHVNFDVDLAKQRSEANPVFYIQYAYARICSVLKKTGIVSSRFNPALLKENIELELLKELAVFPDIIEDVARTYQVQKLPQYVLELASIFHRLYQDCRMIGEDKQLTRARLNLIKATRIVLKEALYLMNISAPKKM